MALNGSSVWIFVYDKDFTAAAPFNDKFIPVAEQKGLSTEQGVNLIECSAKGDGHEKYVYGRSNSSISIDALVPVNPANNQKGGIVLEKSRKNKKVAYIKRAVFDGVSTFSDIEYAEVVVESVSKDYPDDDVVSLSFELKLNGEFFTTAPTPAAMDPLVVGSNAS